MTGTPQPTEPPPRFAKSLDGTVIHRTGCARAGTAMPWRAVEGLQLMELVTKAKRFGLKPCKVCKPFDRPAAPPEA